MKISRKVPMAASILAGLFVVVSVQGAALAPSCSVYLGTHSASIPAYELQNPHESPYSKYFRGNLRRMDLKFFFQGGKHPEMIGSHVVDYQIRLMQAYYLRNQETRALFQILYGQLSTRADVDRWVAEHIPGHRIAWIDELLDIDQSTDLKLKEIAAKVRGVLGKNELVADNGFISHLFYFELIENGYLPVSNDHDLSVHLVQLQHPEGRRVLRRLNQKIMDEFQSNPSLNRQMDSNNGAQHDFSWSPVAVEPRRIDQLLSLWETLQENRIVFHPETKEFALMGGIFTAFSPLHIAGNIGSDEFSTFRFVASYFDREKLKIGQDGKSWAQISRAFAEAGIDAVTPPEVQTAIVRLSAVLESKASELEVMMARRGDGSIGRVVDDYFGKLNQALEHRLDESILASPTPEVIRSVRINEAARKIFLMENNLFALVDCILDAI